jgi:hypothetical protein
VRHFRTLQSAVDEARPGDWILIWPGVYHENDAAHHAGVWITTPRLHIRGLNRGAVIVDGSHGPTDDPCPTSPALQDFSPRDGIVVWNASGVTIDNLTVCNYLAGPGAVHGTQIWWTGASESAPSTETGSGWAGTSSTPAGTAGLGMGSFEGSYLTATSMYAPADVKSQHLAEFGIFAGGASGPGVITHSYASNMANAAFYVGACGRDCNTVLSNDDGAGSAIGYLGTNSGGRLTVESSVFDGNRTGVILVSLNTDDLPPPQDGRCPGSAYASCTLIKNNIIASNDNADAPAFGIDPPIGVGVEIQGGSFDTLTGNHIMDNGAWGVLIADNVDSLSYLPRAHCQGGSPNTPVQNACLFSARGNVVYGNFLNRNGSFGNATNGDFALFSLAPVPPTPRNCFYDNLDSGGHLSSSPAGIQQASVDGPPCNRPAAAGDLAVLEQLGCADHHHCVITGVNYPSPIRVRSITLPQLPAMPNPCSRVPRNAVCQ